MTRTQLLAASVSPAPQLRVGVFAPGLEDPVYRVGKLLGWPVHRGHGEAPGLYLSPEPTVALDALWVVARASRGLDPTLVPTLQHARSPVHLALVQDGPPQHTWHWLDALDPALHLHLREGVDADLQRWARHLSGTAVALVLGGGGARGFAHLGVWQALDEAGIVVDVIAGASMGAVIGAQLAAGVTFEVAHAHTRQAFLGDGGYADYTRPGLSLLAGQRLSMRLRCMLGEDAMLEDLPRPFVCTTTDLQRSSLAVHRRGELWRKVVASGSLPGMAPPCELEGALHVDGGMLEVLPVDAARLPGVGAVLAVDVLEPSQRPLRLPERTGLRLLWSRYRPGGDRRLLTLPDVLQRSLALSAIHSAQQARAQATLTIAPPVEGYSILEVEAFDELVAQGHAAAVPALSDWLGPRIRPRVPARTAVPQNPRRAQTPVMRGREVELEELTQPLERPAGNLCLPQHASPAAQRRRRCALHTMAQHYDWEEEPGLPPYARGLPEPERLRGKKRAWVEGSFAIGGARALGLAAMAGTMGRRLSTFDRFHRVALRKPPLSASQWLDDDFFAQQRLSGNNPVLIEACDVVPHHFGITDALAAPWLEGRSLADAAGECRLYLCDYRMLAGLPRHPGRYVADAMALFYQRVDGQLSPVAIQLGQDPSRDLVFTPADTDADWTLAKLHVQCADGNHHQWVSHLSMTHYGLDPFICAFHRTLPPGHPVHALLLPHLRWTLAINHIARESVAGNQGTFARMKSLGTVGGYPLAKNYLAERSLSTDGLLDNLERRGVLQGLPGYHFRDDAVRVRAPLDAYVGKVLRMFYPRSELLAADVELQQWLDELRGPGKVADLPVRFRSVEQLQAVLTRLIVRVTIWHEAISGWQHHGYSHVPNMPHGLWRPAPTQRGAATREDVLAALPPTRESILQVVASTITPTPNLSTLTEPGAPTFAGCPAAQAVRDELTAELLQVQAAIERDNHHRRFPYRVLEPARVAQSIEV